MPSSRFFLSLICFFSLCLSEQLVSQPAPTPADLRWKGYEQRRALSGNSLLAGLPATSIGPSVFSGRVTDVEANPADPAECYVAYASGGLWHTKNNGTTFKPVFDREATMTIGDIAVDWARGVLWVGTGESNASRSSYAGMGLFRSADGGKTWEHRGLPESHHIGRVVLHPANPDVLWVAVAGHLYSPNPERGVFKTTDGGKTWTRTLFVHENAGAIDLCLDPGDANTLFAASWERERRAWNFSGAGEGSGIWKSSDGGDTWTLVSSPENGFPAGKNIGRIGLCAGRKNGKLVVYASLDNQNNRPPKADKKDDVLTKDALRTMSKADFLALSDERLGAFLKQNNFPEKYNAKKVRELVEKDKIAPITLVEYLEDANNKLFETDYIGAELYRSDDGGRSWRKTHADPLDGIHFTYGYYFSNVRCLPDDPDRVYLLGFYIIRSADGGQNWTSINGDNVHVDHHALWLNPARPGHLINGNDGGLNISWDDGDSWIKCNQPAVGQFYAVAVDEADPFRVYGGTQDNGVWTGPSDYEASPDWQQTGQYPYRSLLGGDGMQIAVDPRDNNTVYAGYQFGNYFRINRSTGAQKYITPKHELGERPLRFNWQTPIQLSRHNPDVLYLGANRLYRSFDRGEHWEAISGDLTGGGRAGNVPYGTLTSISESPRKFGLLYAGSDDGLLHVSRDGGDTWTRISDSLPARLWVSRVVASAHEKGRVYATLNGYRWDDFSAYLYVSDDYGQHWQPLGSDLPAEPLNVVREDPENPDILYVGSDHGLFVSLDRGRHFQAIGKDLPAVAVHDLAVQGGAKTLVVGTHGRSLYRIDLKNTQRLTPEVLAATLYLFDLPNKRFSANWGKKQPWRETKDPELPVTFYANAVGKANWSVRTKAGLVVNNGSVDCVEGLNSFTFALDLQKDMVPKYQKSLEAAQKDAAKPVALTPSDTGKYYLQKGVYIFELERDGVRVSKEFIIE